MRYMKMAEPERTALWAALEALPRDLEAAFAAARADNLAALRRLSGEEWSRSGEQDGVGAVALCDLPAFMHQHDEAHLREIAAWKASRPA